jgi:predicted DNA-binding protein
VVRSRSSGYTPGMKTAISLPDDIFERAERLARRTKRSRSEIYREALREYLARHEPGAITEAMDRVAAEIDTRPDSFGRAAARRALERDEW